MAARIVLSLSLARVAIKSSLAVLHHSILYLMPFRIELSQKAKALMMRW
jgi:uncharacterized membrane protein